MSLVFTLYSLYVELSTFDVLSKIQRLKKNTLFKRIIIVLENPSLSINYQSNVLIPLIKTSFHLSNSISIDIITTTPVKAAVYPSF